MVIKINANDAKQRLDKFLKKRFPKIPTSGVYKALRLKKIKVNNKKAEPNYLLQVGDEISVFLEEQLLNKTVDKQDFHLAPSKLNIVYEDDNVILINKPAGLLTHVDEENTVDTLANRLKKYLYEKKF
jgi:23S rRNA pseudouridine955/2504/2580 synthase